MRSRASQAPLNHLRRPRLRELPDRSMSPLVSSLALASLGPGIITIHLWCPRTRTRPSLHTLTAPLSRLDWRGLLRVFRALARAPQMPARRIRTATLGSRRHPWRRALVNLRRGPALPALVQGQARRPYRALLVSPASVKIPRTNCRTRREALPARAAIVLHTPELVHSPRLRAFTVP